MSGGHTPGPWFFQERFSNAYALSSGDVGTTVHIAKASEAQVPGGYTEAEANARRIVDCVNACEGIADPSVVPELVAALEDCASALISARGFLLHELGTKNRARDDAIERANQTLAKIGGDA